MLFNFSSRLLIAIVLATLSLASHSANVCVFCSSKERFAENHKVLAYELGFELGKRNFGLVTGGRNSGPMNLLIDAHTKANRFAGRYAVITKSLAKAEVINYNIPEENVIHTDNIHDRMEVFHNRCEAIIVLPGGFGTFHEFIDSLESHNFGFIKHPIYLMNTENFWEPTLLQLKNMAATNAVDPARLNQVQVVYSVKELMTLMQPLSEQSQL